MVRNYSKVADVGEIWQRDQGLQLQWLDCVKMATKLQDLGGEVAAEIDSGITPRTPRIIALILDDILTTIEKMSYNKMLGQNQVWASGQDSDDVVGTRQEFIEGIEKLTWNTPGDRQKKTVRLVGRISEVAGLLRVRFIVKLDGLVWL
ncbi:hypothetical protein BHE74_00010255 [Ensete ventricosum]|nr:hypothetical protein BHE74_00010255 [Ensete ventricosum]